MYDGKKKQNDTTQPEGTKGGEAKQQETEEVDYEESMDEENPDMAVTDIEDDMP